MDAAAFVGGEKEKYEEVARTRREMVASRAELDALAGRITGRRRGRGRGRGQSQAQAHINLYFLETEGVKFTE